MKQMIQSASKHPRWVVGWYRNRVGRCGAISNMIPLLSPDGHSSPFYNTTRAKLMKEVPFFRQGEGLW